MVRFRRRMWSSHSHQGISFHAAQAGFRLLAFLNAGQAASHQPATYCNGRSINGKTVAYITASISYTDPSGAAFSTDTSLAFNVSGVTATSESGGYSSPSATPTTSKRPQLVISNYKSDLDPLQPGLTFSLSLDIGNVGSTTCQEYHHGHGRRKFQLRQRG